MLHTICHYERNSICTKTVLKVCTEIYCRELSEMHDEESWLYLEVRNWGVHIMTWSRISAISSAEKEKVRNCPMRL